MKIGDKVIIKNTLDPCYRRRGVIAEEGGSYDWVVRFSNGDIDWFNESELKLYVPKKKEKKDHFRDATKKVSCTHDWRYLERKYFSIEKGLEIIEQSILTFYCTKCLEIKEK